MRKKAPKARSRAISPDETRRGYFGGVMGLSYGPGGYYLNPDQFGYGTAQTPYGDMTTTTATSGGDSSGATGVAGGGTGGGTT